MACIAASGPGRTLQIKRSAGQDHEFSAGHVRARPSEVQQVPATARPHLHVSHRLCASALQQRLLGLLGLHTPDVAQRKAPAYGLPHGWWVQVYIVFSFVTPADTHSLRSQGEALVTNPTQITVAIALLALDWPASFPSLQNAAPHTYCV